MLYTRAFHTQKLLYTDPCTHKNLHGHFLHNFESRIKTFTHRRLYTGRLLHTDSFTHQKLQFCFSFCRSTLISCKRVVAEDVNPQFYCSFCGFTFISCESVAFRAWRLVGTVPSAEREKLKGRRGGRKERWRERETEREGEREDQKMCRCEDDMCRCEEERM